MYKMYILLSTLYNTGLKGHYTLHHLKTEYKSMYSCNTLQYIETLWVICFKVVVKHQQPFLHEHVSNFSV